MSGWYASKRGTLEHPLFKPSGPFSRFEAWHWLIEHAAWKATTHRIGGTIHEVPRGSLFITLRQLRDAWGWKSDKRVRLFLAELRREDTIGLNSDAGKTLITLCNYEKYQGAEQARDAAGTQPGRSRDAIKEQVNNSAKAGDPAAVVFGQVRAWLVEATGKSDGAVRRILGGWCRDHGHGEVIDACSRAQREGAVDPVAFVEGCWRQKRRQGGSDDERLRAWGIRDLDAEDDERNLGGSGDHRPPASRHAAGDVSGLLAHPAEEGRPVSERDVQAGRGCLELLALRH